MRIFDFLKLVPASLILMTASVKAQVGNNPGDADVIFNDLTKKYFQDRRYDRVEGSPFMLDDWSTGALELKGGRRFEAMRMKFDLVAQEVIFLNGQNVEMVAPSDRIKLFQLSDGTGRLTFRSGYPALDKQSTNSFYQVLLADTLALLKFAQKSIVEGNDFDKKKSFILYEDYFVHYSNKLWVIRKKDSFSKILPSKSKEVELFISQNKLKPKNESDLRKVVSFMNSLVRE